VTAAAATAPVRHREVVCPFCSLACDDLEVEAAGAGLRVVANGCPISVPEFARPLGDASPLVDGRPASLAEAVRRAAALLGSGRLPLLAGLGTDTAGARAAVALAEALGGVLDHAAGAGLLANIRAMQDAGWVTATLAEARNRPGLMLFVGTDAAAVAPRLLERLLRRGPRLAPAAEDPALVFLGPAPPAGVSARHVPCPPAALPLALALLEAAAAGRPVAASDAAFAADDVAGIGRELRGSPYSLVVWAAGELPGPHADLLVGRLASLLRSLNATTRAVGLPLAGYDNPIGANQVCAWQTGVPLRTSLATGAPDHDSWRYGAARLLAEGAVDRLLWVASFRDAEPPACDLPTVALARAGCVPSRPVEVLIPVGTPGLDHAGSVYRTDSVVSLPVRKLREAGLPTVAGVLDAIRAGLAGA
jgi:formylmethanofuran dehydrogenase subunit B